jgi:hypothetical protein
MPLPIDGAIAHDAVDAGKPIKIGGKGNSAAPTKVAAGDRVDAWFGLAGEMVVLPYMPLAVRSGDTVGPKTVTLTLTTNAALLAAPGSGVSLVIMGMIVGNSSATLTIFNLVEGGADAATDGTIIFSQPLAANGGGFTNDQVFVLPTNTALKARLGTGVTDVRVNLMYRTIIP